MSEAEECRAFVVHLRAEHRRLHELVRVIEQALLPSQDTVEPLTKGEFVARLRSLRHELQHHFDEEDSGGCMEEAVSRRPELARDASLLEHEHPRMIAQLNEIIELAQASEDKFDEPIRQQFSDFTRNLHAHEASENWILAEGFDLEIDEVGP